MATATQQLTATQLTEQQLRDQLALDIATNLRLRGYKLDDNGLLAVCTAAYDITKAVAKKSLSNTACLMVSGCTFSAWRIAAKFDSSVGFSLLAGTAPSR